jgi:hypothetical protein
MNLRMIAPPADALTWPAPASVRQTEGVIEMRLPGQRVLLLREGVFDAAAQLAFLDGHCHSLALALARAPLA